MLRWIGPWLFATVALCHEAWIVAPGIAQRLRIVNGQEFDQTVRVSFIDEFGTPLHETEILVPSKQGTWLDRPENLVPRAIRIRSIATVAVSMRLLDGDIFDVQQAQKASQIPLLIPHIAEDTVIWNTRADVVSAAGSNPVRIRTPESDSLFPMPGPHGAQSIDLEALFQQGIGAGNGWGTLRADQRELTALVTFSDTLGRRSASLPLPFQRSNVLILPHVPADRINFWAGLAIINSSHTDLTLSAHGYANGSVIAYQSAIIPARSKQVGLIDDLLQEPWPAEVAWIELRGNQPFAGFELFGHQNGATLTGLPLSLRLFKNVAYEHVAAQDWWTGLVLLNPGNQPIDIGLSVRDDQGSVVQTTTLSLAAFAKQTLLPESLWGLRSDRYWIQMQSDHGFISFQLYGDHAQQYLATLRPSPLPSGSVQLGLPIPSLDLAENVSQAPSDVADMDGNGDDELVILTEEQLAVIDWNPQPQQTLSPHVSFDYVNETGVPAFTYLKDLDADGHQELMVTTRDLTLASFDDAYVPTRIQPYRPEVADDPMIRDFADINQDGMLDILTNRRLFKSQLGLNNFYYWNTFPYMFATSGRGSLFMPLDEDPRIDILTVLFDSFFAVISDDLDAQLDPIYTPDPFRDVISMYRADFDHDGAPDVLSLIAESHNAGGAEMVDIASFSADGATTLAQFDVPLEWGLNQLVQVTQSDGAPLFGQEIGNLTRYWKMGLESAPAIEQSRAWRGHDADINGDGLRDLVAPNGVILGEPQGSWYDPALSMLIRETTSAEIIPYIDDFDDDVQNEVLTLRHTGSSTFYTAALWEYSYDGRHWEQEPLLSVNVTGLGFADLWDADQDGDLDFVVAGYGLRYYERLATGFADTPTFIHTPDVFSIGKCRKTHLDSNAFADLIGEHLSGSKQIVIVHDAYGPNPVTQLLPLYVSIDEIEVLDIDRDGDLDIRMDSPSRGRQMWLQQDGQWSQKNFNFNFDTYDMVDFTGDGHLDVIAYLATPDTRIQYLRFLKNRGDLQFFNIYTLELPSDTFYSRIRVMDVDGDGRQDVLGLGKTKTAASQYLDIWKSGYTEVIEEIPFNRIRRIEWRNESNTFQLKDFDFDGWLDLQFWVDYHFLWYRARTSYHPEASRNPYPWPMEFSEESTANESMGH